MATKTAFNVQKFVGDLISGAEKAEDIDPTSFGVVLITALVKQLDGADPIIKELSRGQKAARTRKRNAAKKAEADSTLPSSERQRAS